MSDTETELLVNGVGATGRGTQPGPQIGQIRPANNPIGSYIQMVRYFNGEDDSVSFADFIQTLELASEFGNWTETQKVGVFRSRVIGPALVFMNGCRDLKTLTYGTLKEKFEEWYRPLTPSVDPIASYYQSKQRPGEGARSFMERLRAKAVAAAPDSMPETDKKIRQKLIDKSVVSIFVKGLTRSSGSSQVAMLKPNTLAEALQLAVMYEESVKHPSNRISLINTEDRDQDCVHGGSNPVSPQCPRCTEHSHCQSSGPTADSAASEMARSRTICAVDRRKDTGVDEMSEIRAMIKALATQVSHFNNLQQQSQSQPREQPPRRIEQQPNVDKSKIVCYKCRNFGHYSPQCPTARRSAASGITCSYCRRANHGEPDCWFKQRDQQDARGRPAGNSVARTPQETQRSSQRVSFEPSQGSQPQGFGNSSGAGSQRTERNHN